jgi:hypothetical protein
MRVLCCGWKAGTVYQQGCCKHIQAHSSFHSRPCNILAVSLGPWSAALQPRIQKGKRRQGLCYRDLWCT